MEDTAGKAGSKIPQEIVYQIIKDVMQGSRYNLNKPEADFRFFRGGFHDLVPMHRPPAYAGLLLCSKAVSKEVQRLLYKESMFRASLCRGTDSMAPVIRLGVYDRIQKVELFLELNSLYQSFIIRRKRENYYRDWFEVFGGSGVHREHCRITITPLVFGFYPWTKSNPIHRSLCEKCIEGCKAFVGFEIVVLELEVVDSSLLVPLPPRSFRAATGPVQDPDFAGDELEAFEEYVEMELQPSLGICKYYDRDSLHCMEFRPRDAVDAISPGQLPFVNLVDD